MPTHVHESGYFCLVLKGVFTESRRHQSRVCSRPAFLTLEVTAPIGREAGEFAERYALRGFDALHLASFVEIARLAGPAETRFSSFDDLLNKASRDVARRLQRGR